MDTSRTLINAQINFIDGSLRLIHIPLTSYSSYVQTILQLMFPAEEDGSVTTERSLPWGSRRPFFNLSINSVECSILCSTDLAEKYFGGCAHQKNLRKGSGPSVSSEDFVAISVEGEGLEAGQRVLDLTTPLAMASIPIFFITTYFCDYILVPLSARSKVVHALEERGFVFESVPLYGASDPSDHSDASDAVGAAAPNPTTTTTHAHHRNRSSMATSTLTTIQGAQDPATPPPASVAEMQTRTFSLLHKRSIRPKVLSDVRLVQCAGGREDGDGGARHLALQLGLVRCLARPPRFLSATLTATEPPAVLLEESTRRAFFSMDAGAGGSGHHDDGGEAANALLGGTQNALVPIMLNLEPLPLEATGIVCGVAGRMAEATQSGVGAIEMSYLSTARTGTVLIEEADLDDAVKALNVDELGVEMV